MKRRDEKENRDGAKEWRNRRNELKMRSRREEEDV